MSLEIDPPDDLHGAEKDAWERGAKAGVRWLQSVIATVDVGGTEQNPAALDPSMTDDGTCPECSGELMRGLGEQDECRRCGYRP